MAVQQLQVWEQALAAAPEGALVPVVGVNRIQNTVGDPDTFQTPAGLAGGIIELASGADRSAPDTAGPLPVVGAAAAAFAAWQQHTDADPANGTSVLTNPRWETRQMLTSAGSVDVPVWHFDVEGSSVTVTAAAVDARYLITPRGMPEDFFGATAHRISDRTVAFIFFGAPPSCAPEYKVHAVEGVRVFTVAVEAIRHFTLGGCVASAESRTLTVELEQPIGDRIFVGPDGRPIFVSDTP